MVRFSNGWEYSYNNSYGPDHLKTGQFEIRSSKSLDFNPYCIATANVKHIED